MKISDKIKQARIKLSLTQEDVADKLEISRQTLSNWENGKTLPDIANVLKMSDLYNVSLDELLKGDVDMKKKIFDEQKYVATMKRVFNFIVGLLLIVAVVNFIAIFVKGNFKDFVDGATPWVVMGIAMIAFASYVGAREDSLVEEEIEEN